MLSLSSRTSSASPPPRSRQQLLIGKEAISWCQPRGAGGSGASRVGSKKALFFSDEFSIGRQRMKSDTKKLVQCFEQQWLAQQLVVLLLHLLLILRFHGDEGSIYPLPWLSRGRQELLTLGALSSFAQRSRRRLCRADASLLRRRLHLLSAAASALSLALLPSDPGLEVALALSSMPRRTKGKKANGRRRRRHRRLHRCRLLLSPPASSTSSPPSPGPRPAPSRSSPAPSRPPWRRRSSCRG